MSNQNSLTSTSLIGTSNEFLVQSKYYDITPDHPQFWQLQNTRLYEDEYGIVCLVVYETFSDLLNDWEIAQMNLVDIISENIPSNEPKVWDSYLLLLTPSKVSNREKINEIRSDTTRTRKIVATGNRLNTRDDVETVLSPILPLDTGTLDDETIDIMELITRNIASKSDIKTEYIREIINAYEAHEPMIEKLHKIRENHEVK